MRKVLIPLDGKYAGLLRIESFYALKVEMLRKILVPLVTSMMHLSVKIESFSAPGCGASEEGVDFSRW